MIKRSVIVCKCERCLRKIDIKKIVDYGKMLVCIACANKLEQKKYENYYNEEIPFPTETELTTATATAITTDYTKEERELLESIFGK